MFGGMNTIIDCVNAIYICIDNGPNMDTCVIKKPHLVTSMSCLAPECSELSMQDSDHNHYSVIDSSNA